MALLNVTVPELTTLTDGLRLNNLSKAAAAIELAQFLPDPISAGREIDQKNNLAGYSILYSAFLDSRILT